MTKLEVFVGGVEYWFRVFGGSETYFVYVLPEGLRGREFTEVEIYSYETEKLLRTYKRDTVGKCPSVTWARSAARLAVDRYEKELKARKKFLRRMAQ